MQKIFLKNPANCRIVSYQSDFVRIFICFIFESLHNLIFYVGLSFCFPFFFFFIQKSAKNWPFFYSEIVSIIYQLYRELCYNRAVFVRIFTFFENFFKIGTTFTPSNLGISEGGTQNRPKKDGSLLTCSLKIEYQIFKYVTCKVSRDWGYAMTSERKEREFPKQISGSAW